MIQLNCFPEKHDNTKAKETKEQPSVSYVSCIQPHACTRIPVNLCFNCQLHTLHGLHMKT